jgi:hypothetical protein
LVTFSHADELIQLRGYYAGDGHADVSSADSGDIWQVKFTPPSTGVWRYTASLERADNIALAENTTQGQALTINNPEGVFRVVKSDKELPDFRASGRLTLNDGAFYFADKKRYWLKTGTNSPENLLAYEGFDGTYRMHASDREGEAKANTALHQFTPHLNDWLEGDLTWKDGKGKGLVGLINYLSTQGMNANYFLTMNINGDGKDVWPYTSPTQFDRFDVSRLAQWELVFQYMQSKGILLHIVTQETENERLLDDGDTGPMRQLYYQELIARFGHHLAVVWNLGEENGPAEWSPPAQNDEQRKAMARFIKTHDPYDHPVFLHTHSEDKNRDDLLDALLGYPYIDGLSFQEAEPAKAGETILHWRRKSKAAGHEWAITMDEIGPWYTGAASDEETPGHPALVKDVLWGTLLSGATGVEWYFGAKTKENDLTAEDLRLRHDLWQYSRHAKDFFSRYIPWWNLISTNESVLSPVGAFASQFNQELFVAFVPKTEKVKLDLSGFNDNLEIHWYNPFTGGELISGGVVEVSESGVVELDMPIDKLSEQGGVLYIRKK